MKKILQVFGFALIFICPLGVKSEPLSTEQVPTIMERFFKYHIENKELTVTIVRRSFKSYIEYFDGDKSYFLKSEIISYLKMSDRDASKIVERMKGGDFSDFNKLNVLIEGAIRRSKALRPQVFEKTFQELASGIQLGAVPSDYAKNEKELQERIQGKFVRFLAYHQRRSPLNSYEKKMKVTDLMERKLSRIENSYLFLDSNGNKLSNVQRDHLTATRILKAFAKSLDAHTTFFSEEEAYEMRLSLEKQFEGFGVVLSEGIDGIVIAEVIPGSPAARSGQIKENDLLMEVDGSSVEKVSFEDVLELMKKRENPELTLGVQSYDFKNGYVSGVKRVKLIRAPIVMDQERINYSYEPYGNGIIAKITLHSFYENGGGINSENDIRIALGELSKHGPIKGLVLDLRENAGGFLSQAVKVAGLFLSSGVVVISKYGKDEIHYLRNIDPRTTYSGPMVVLTSKLSASAAEIVAQALQDYGVALVVGDRRTFGKGSIQYQTVTDEKAEIFFKVTVGKYYTVSGKTTQINGVIADIHIPSQFAPFNIGEKYLEYPLTSDRMPAAYVDSLSDLDEKFKGWFVSNYLPNLQRKITFYQKMIPELKKNSAQRIKKNPDYQAFLKNQESIRSRLGGDLTAPVDLNMNFGSEDIQMAESVHVLKDMIYLEIKQRKAASAMKQTEKVPFSMQNMQKAS